MATTIMCFGDSVPLGWTEYTAARNRLLRGASTGGGTGGASTHTHTFSAGATTTAYTPMSSVHEGVLAGQLVADHSHTVAAIAGITSGAGSSLPSYFTAIPVVYSEEFDE